MKRLNPITIPEDATFEHAFSVWTACGYHVSCMGWSHMHAWQEEENLPGTHEMSLRIEDYWRGYHSDGATTVGEWTSHLDAPQTFAGVLRSVIQQWNEFVRKETEPPKPEVFKLEPS